MRLSGDVLLSPCLNIVIDESASLSLRTCLRLTLLSLCKGEPLSGLPSAVLIRLAMNALMWYSNITLSN